MTQNGFRRKHLKWHENYAKRAYGVFIKVFQDWGKNIDFDSMNAYNYSMVVNNAVDTEQLEEAYKKVYGYIGLLQGKRISHIFITNLKFFTLHDFESAYVKEIVEWILGNGAERITSVEETFKADINRIIAKGLEEGKGIDIIAKELQTFVNKRSFYRWQAQRIARTEATSAANMGAMSAGRIAGVVMDKVWISAQDPRTRRIPQDKFDHLHMNAVRIRESEPFEVRSLEKGVEPLMFPGDPNGSAGNVINCRCAVALIAARDKDGNLILT